MKIVISPYSQKLPKAVRNPKNYPYWAEVVTLLKQHYPDIKICQIGVAGEEVISGVTEVLHNLPPAELLKQVQDCNLWMSVDNFFQHFCTYYKIPNGFVLFGQSDPDNFGYKQNTNLLKSRKLLRPRQFDFWWDTPYREDVFMSAEEVVIRLLPVLKNT